MMASPPTSVAVTLAPAITSPPGSFTLPEIWVCAQESVEKQKRQNAVNSVFMEVVYVLVKKPLQKLQGFFRD